MTTKDAARERESVRPSEAALQAARNWQHNPHGPVVESLAALLESYAEQQFAQERYLFDEKMAKLKVAANEYLERTQEREGQALRPSRQIRTATRPRHPGTGS